MELKWRWDTWRMQYAVGKSGHRYEIAWCLHGIESNQYKLVFKGEAVGYGSVKECKAKAMALELGPLGEMALLVQEATRKPVTRKKRG